MRSRITALLIPVLFLALPLAATAQWTNDPYNDMVNVCNAEDEQSQLKICELSDNRIFIGWRDERTNPITAYYQILNMDGTILLEENGVPLIDANWITAIPLGVDIIPDGAGGCITIFKDARDGTLQIYGQRISPSGERLWGDTGLPILTYPGYDLFIHDVVFDSLGNGFVGSIPNWAPSPYDLYVQKFDLLNGDRLWGESGILVCTGQGASINQELVPDGRGGVLVLWEDNRIGSASSYDIFGQHLLSDGTPRWAENGVQLHDPSTNYFSVIAVSEGISCGDGHSIWAHTNEGGGAHVTRLNDQGQVVWYTPHIYTGQLLVAWIQAMLLHPVNGYLWVSNWESYYPPDTSKYILYIVDPETGTSMVAPAALPWGGMDMVATSDGVITFDVRYSDHRTRLLAYKVDSTGHLQWLSDVALGGIHPSGAPNFYYPECASDGNDGAVCAFVDWRNVELTFWDISAQRVLFDGTLGNPPVSHFHVNGARLDLLTTISAGTIRYVLPEAGRIQLRLYNVLGQRVNLIDEGYRQAGSHVVHFSNQNLPSGIYLLLFTTPSTRQTAKIVIVR